MTKLEIKTPEEHEVSLLAEDVPFDLAEPKRGGYALIEIMGHRSHHGFVREVSLFGAPMVEVLVPFYDKPGVQFRHVYGGSSVFSLTPIPLASAKANAPRPWSVTTAAQLQAG